MREGYGTWSVCVSVSVCLSVTTFSPTSRNKTAKMRYVRLHCYTSFILKLAIFPKSTAFKLWREKANKLISMTCAYRDIIWRRWSDISPEISKTGPFLVLLKSNGRLQATWHSKAASY